METRPILLNLMRFLNPRQRREIATLSAASKS
jgi:hypothetical protein